MGVTLPGSTVILVPIAVALLILGYKVYRRNPLSVVNKIFFVLMSVVLVGWTLMDLILRIYNN